MGRSHRAERLDHLHLGGSEGNENDVDEGARQLPPLQAPS